MEGPDEICYFAPTKDEVDINVSTSRYVGYFLGVIGDNFRPILKSSDMLTLNLIRKVVQA